MGSLAKPRRDIIKGSLLSLYADDEAICDALRRCDTSSLSHKFYKELFHRIEEDTFYKIEALLLSDDVALYYDAIQRASMACTVEMANLIEFVLNDNEGGSVQ